MQGGYWLYQYDRHGAMHQRSRIKERVGRWCLGSGGEGQLKVLCCESRTQPHEYYGLRVENCPVRVSAWPSGPVWGP